MACKNQEMITTPPDRDVSFNFEQRNILSLFQRLWTQLSVFMRAYINTSIEWRNLLYQYIQLKLQMIIAMISRDYRREIQIYDRVFDLTTTMGSYMARGLIAQQSHDIQ